MDPFILVAIGALIVLGGILGLRLNAFLALFVAALVISWMTPESNIEIFAAAKNLSAQETTQLLQQSAPERVANGFGSTCAKIGILIALASIIGKSMLDSGAADRIVRSAIRLLGEKRAPVAFLGSGFFLAIPVFYDTVFYLLLPLGKAMATRNERNYLLYILSIVAGTAMTHSLVPPTPGPLFVAAALNVDIGTMMMGGIVVGFFTVAAGYAYALWANSKWEIPLRETNDISLKELKTLSAKKDHELPSFWLSILPIILPVVLIAGRTIINATADISDLALSRMIDNLGNSNTALAIAAAIAMATLVLTKRNDKKQLSASVGAALSSAGTIILITAAGGAFGGILQQTGIGPSIEGLANNYQIAVLPLAFFVTLLVRTAQGSATVAMITAVGILSGFANPETLGFHPVYLALVIGCGSKIFPWMNDSGFWIISKMSGFTERETLKTFSVMLSIMGFTGLIVVMVLAKFFPFV